MNSRAKETMDSKMNNNEKIPKRVVHFCDGSVPEYSSDEETGDCIEPTRIVHIDPASFTWTDWLRFKSMEIAYAALNVCDYLGDSLSSFFGITTPKYQFEIDHFNMMKKLNADISDTECNYLSNRSDISKIEV